MNLLNQVIDILNEKLFNTALTDGIFDGARIYNLASLGMPSEGSPQRPYTMVQGEPIYVDVSDDKPATVYHRCTNITMENISNLGWGDNDGYISAKFDMLMIFYGNPVFVKYSNEDLILKTSAALNYTLNTSDINAVGLRFVRSLVNRANTNSLQVFTGEYGASADCPLQFNSVYFGVQYQIEIQATSDCLGCYNCTNQ